MGAMMFLCMRLAAYIGHKSHRSKGKQSREALRATPMRIPQLGALVSTTFGFGQRWGAVAAATQSEALRR
jgi:hypothetical protein